MDVALGVCWGWCSPPRWRRAGGWCRAAARARPGGARCSAPSTPRPRCCRTCGAGLAPRARGPAAPHAARCSPAPTRSRSPTPTTLLAFDGAGADHHRAGDPLGGARRPRPRGPRARRAAAALRRPGLPAALGDRRAAARPASAASARSSRSTSGPGRVRLEESRVVGEAAALVSAMIELSELEAQGERLAARRAARAARPDLAALHLQRARRGRVVHPLAPGGGARAADRVLRLHPLRVRAPAPVRDARRRAAVRREVPAARAGALRRAAAGARAGRPRGAAGGGPRALAAAAGRERRAPRRRVARRAAGASRSSAATSAPTSSCG